MNRSVLILLFTIFCTSILNAGTIKELSEGYATVAKINHDIEWGFLLIASPILVGMFASFGKVAGKFRSDWIKIPVSIAYILGIILCSILIILQFQNALVVVFDKISDIF